MSTNIHLFSQKELRSLKLKNRIVVSPMCQYRAVEGHIQDWHMAHHSRFALGGMALSFVEATGVEPKGRISPGCVGLWDNKTEAALKRVIDFCKDFEHLLFDKYYHNIYQPVQLNHFLYYLYNC